MLVLPQPIINGTPSRLYQVMQLCQVGIAVNDKALVDHRQNIHNVNLQMIDRVADSCTSRVHAR